MNKNELRNKLMAELNALKDKSESDVLSKEERDLVGDKIKQLDELNSEIQASDDIRSAIASKIADLNKPAKKVTSLVTATESRDWQESKEYRQWFYGEYLKDGRESREFRDLSLGTGSAGGYILPKVTYGQIWEKLEEKSVIFNVARKIPIYAGGTSIPIVSSAMTEMTFPGETTSVTQDSGLTFAERNLSPLAGRVAIYVSNALTYSASDLESFIVNEMVRTAQRGLDKTCLGSTGNGSGKPLSISVASANGIPTTRDVTAAASDKIVWTDLVNVFDSVATPYQVNGAWFMHPDARKMLRRLVDGESRPLFTDFSNGGDFRILGRPVYVSSYMQAATSGVFTTGQYPIVFGDPNEYALGIGADFAIKRLDQIGALSGQDVWYGQMLTNGTPVQPEAWARLKMA